MIYSFGYYKRELEWKIRSFGKFFTNAWRFRKFLSQFREWSGGDNLQEFFSDYLYVMHKFYSDDALLLHEDEVQKILSQLNQAHDMLEPAFDEHYHLEDHEKFDYEENFPIKDDFIRSYVMYEIDRDRFFEFIAKNHRNWWE